MAKTKNGSVQKLRNGVVVRFSVFHDNVHIATQSTQRLSQLSLFDVCDISSSFRVIFVLDWRTATVLLPFDMSIPTVNIWIHPVVNCNG